jgi:hypothetical protein
MVVSNAPVAVDIAPAAPSAVAADTETEAALEKLRAATAARSSGRGWWIAAAAGLLLAAATLFLLRSSSWQDLAEASDAPPQAAAVPNPEPASQPAAPSARAQVDPAETAAPSSEAAEEEPTPPSTTAKSVLIRVHPPDAEIYYNAELLGTGNLQISVEPGERKMIEIRAPGYAARGLPVDGTESEIRVGLKRKRDSSAAVEPPAEADSTVAGDDSDEPPAASKPTEPAEPAGPAEPAEPAEPAKPPKPAPSKNLADPGF